MPRFGKSRLAPALTWPQRLWQEFDRQYFRKVLSIDPQNLIGYWPLWEPSGSVAYDYSGQGNHGAYVGVNLLETGIGDGRSSGYFDGANDYVDIYSAGLGADFDGDEGSVLLWMKVNGAGVWTDGTIRSFVNIGGTDERVTIRRPADNGVLQWYRRAGGVTDLVTLGGFSDTDWMNLALTWSVAADELKSYKDGSQVGATQGTLGAWATALTENLTNIGSQSEGPADPAHGWEAHAALWKTPLSAQQLLRLSQR